MGKFAPPTSGPPCLPARKYVISAAMSVDEIEKAAEKLSTKERARLRAFLDELEAAEVDAALERDIRAGKFDKLAEQARADHAAGETKPL